MSVQEPWGPEQKAIFWVKHEEKKREEFDRRLKNFRASFYIAGACVGTAIAIASWHSSLAYKTDLAAQQKMAAEERLREHATINQNVKALTESISKNKLVVDNVRENLARVMWAQDLKIKPLKKEDDDL